MDGRSRGVRLHAMARANLRTIVLVAQAPMWLFGVAIIGITAWVHERVSALFGRLVLDLEDGRLTSGQLHEVAAQFDRVWFGSLTLFMLALLGAAACALLLVRRTDERIRRIRSWIDAVAAGEEPAAPLHPVADDELGALEETVARAGRLWADDRERALRELTSQRFASRIQRALDYVDTEEDVLEVMEVALGSILPEGVACEVLLADASDAHLRRVVGCAAGEERGCQVGTPHSCAAVRRGSTLSFASSEDLDACPHLRTHARRPLGALCTPMNVMGRSIGVVHLQGAEGVEWERSLVRELEILAAHVGTRLSMVRTLATSQVQAATDPLTGLLNRRSFEARVQQVLASHPDTEHAVIMADLDHFKHLNDTAGHATGDRALRLFARVLAQAARKQDILGRHGGEEFVLFLVDCDERQALRVLERVQEQLALEVGRAGLPRVTASFGVAIYPVDGRDLDEVVERADAALYEAKRGGRNRACTTTGRVQEGPGSGSAAHGEASPGNVIDVVRARGGEGTDRDVATR